MIKTAEVRRRARMLGVQEFHVLRDYVLNHVLASVADLASALTFRGGTALTRVYWPDFRLSEDLDFLSADRLDTAPVLAEALAEASRRTRIDLRSEAGPMRDGLQRTLITWGDHELIVDVTHGKCYLEIERQPLDLPYTDLQGSPRTIAVQALAEILGNKWYMLMDRREPRDLFDLWEAIHARAFPFADVARGHLARYGYLPLRESLDHAQRLQPLWEMRLAHQLRDLPPFSDVLTTVERAFSAWREAITPRT